MRKLAGLVILIVALSVSVALCGEKTQKLVVERIRAEISARKGVQGMLPKGARKQMNEAQVKFLEALVKSKDHNVQKAYVVYQISVDLAEHAGSKSKEEDEEAAALKKLLASIKKSTAKK